MHWRDAQRENITTVEELGKIIPLSQMEYFGLKQIHRKYPVNIPRYYLSLIDPHNENDPIRKMIIPNIEEAEGRGYFDTSGELDNTKITGVQHKYRQTALLLLTNYCFANCRFCFRKRFVGIKDDEVLRDVRAGVAYVKEHPEITNLLLSGGDALSLSNRLISKILRECDSIPHLKYIRIGTRAPVVFPQRVLSDDGLVRILKRHTNPNRRLIIQTHYNHPKEITEEATACIATLIKNGIMTHNQTVLLKGVNDDPHILSDLKSSLISIGVHPYYLFQCRPVLGSLHMQVPIVKGYTIVEEAKSYLSGPAKMFKYIMSHRSGKIEIVGLDDERVYLKYHQAKNPKKVGKFFSLQRVDYACWFDELLHHQEVHQEASGGAENRFPPQ